MAKHETTYIKDGQLSADFWRLVKADPHVSPIAYKHFAKAAEAIRASEWTIIHYFEEHGNLMGIRVKGMGDSSKPYVHKLLKEGFEKARERQNGRAVAVHNKDLEVLLGNRRIHIDARRRQGYDVREEE